jgi:gluconokinase
MIWADNRAAGIAAKIRNSGDGQEFYRRTGLPIHAMSPLCKLIWLQENQADLFNRAYKFIGIKEYVFLKLFGVYFLDVSMASATGLMNAGSLQWDSWVLEQVGISTDRLSEITGIDKIFTNPRHFPSLQQVPFIIGGSDGAMANLGATDEPGSLVITIGTSSAARLILNKPHIDPEMRTFCYYIHNQQWLLGGASNNGGIVLQWLQENFFHSEKTVTDFLKQASGIAPGAEGLIFLPYLLGERAPVWNAAAKGILFGLDIRHGQEHMIRASMEAVIYCLYGICQPLFEQAEIKNIYATGGFARTELWLQVLADVFNLPVMICDTVENSAWGAVRCGMQATGEPFPKNAAIRKSYTPDESVHPVYKKTFQKFQRLYELLKVEYEK